MGFSSPDVTETLPTIHSTRRVVEECWDEYLTANPGPDHPADAIDSFLVRRWLDFYPNCRTVIDTAAGTTRGAYTVIALAHPSPRRVLAFTRSSADDEVAAMLRAYARDRHPDRPFDLPPSSDVLCDVAESDGLLILTDARASTSDGLASEISRWLVAQPDAVVLVSGVGRVGDCEAFDDLLSLCRPGAGHRLWLVRELSEALAGSRLAVVTRRDHPDAATTALRLARAFTGNVNYLDLLWDHNEAAIRATGADRLTLAGHPSGIPVLAEVEEYKRQAASVRAEADGMRAQLAAARAEAGRLSAEVDRLRGDLAAARGHADSLSHQTSYLQAQCESEAAARLHHTAAHDNAVREFQRAQASISQLEAELAAVRGSRSVRLVSRLNRLLS